jgi:ribonuclease HI
MTIKHTSAEGASSAVVVALHTPHPDNTNAGRQGPGLRKAGTVRANSMEVRALNDALTEVALSRARVAELVGLSKTVVQGWFTGLRPIQTDKLQEKCPRLHKAWQAKLAVMRGEESAA